MNMNKYDKQATDFLSKNLLKMRINLSNSKPAHWEPSGNHYRVTISGKLRRITFDFWGSVHQADNNLTPREYSVLACISSDVYVPNKFKDFCDEYGYEEDSIKAMQTWQRCIKFERRLRAFFTDAEIEQLQEIR